MIFWNSMSYGRLSGRANEGAIQIVAAATDGIDFEDYRIEIETVRP